MSKINSVFDAIKHCQDIISDVNECEECRDEHRLLSSWLEELVTLRTSRTEQGFILMAFMYYVKESLRSDNKGQCFTYDNESKCFTNKALDSINEGYVLVVNSKGFYLKLKHQNRLFEVYLHRTENRFFLTNISPIDFIELTYEQYDTDNWALYLASNILKENIGDVNWNYPMLKLSKDLYSHEMNKPPYSVKSVVCDYGVYEGDELKIIVNRFENAVRIKDILNEDSKKFKEE